MYDSDDTFIKLMFFLGFMLIVGLFTVGITKYVIPNVEVEKDEFLSRFEITSCEVVDAQISFNSNSSMRSSSNLINGTLINTYSNLKSYNTTMTYGEYERVYNGNSVIYNYYKDKPSGSVYLLTVKDSKTGLEHTFISAYNSLDKNYNYLVSEFGS